MEFLWSYNFVWQSFSQRSQLRAAGKSHRPVTTHKNIAPCSTRFAFTSPLAMPCSLQSGFPGLPAATAGLLNIKAASTGKPLQMKDDNAERASRPSSAPSIPPCPHPWGRKAAGSMEVSGTLVMGLNCFSLAASTGFLLLSACVSRGEHMGLGDLMFHGLLGCQNVLHFYLLQHSRWSSLRKKKTCAAGP